MFCILIFNIKNLISTAQIVYTLNYKTKYDAVSLKTFDNCYYDHRILREMPSLA